MERIDQRHEPALQVTGLTVDLDGNSILRDLSFTIAAGSLAAVIGPNGSGKTMLLRALIGAVPHSGTVRWAPGTRIGYVPQKLDIERNLPVTGRDLLAAQARLTGVQSSDILMVLGRVGLTQDILDRLVGAISGGQFQRLLMATALLPRPTMLLLDEPTTGIDEPGQERLNETVLRLQREGVTVLMVSHDLSVVHRFATHVLCITRDHGCLGVPGGVLTPEMLSEVYGEPVGFFRHDEPRA